MAHDLKLVDQNGVAINLRAGQKVTVELEYLNDTTEAADFASPKIITVEIVGTVDGVNSVRVINQIANDSTYEGNESYTLKIKSVNSNVYGLGQIEIDSSKNSVRGEIIEDDSPKPVTTDDIINTFEDKSKALSLEDFGTYSGNNTNSPISVKIVTLPDNGVLKLNGVTISAGVVISANDINNGKLVYVPNLNTDKDSSFTFQVSDGNDWSLTHTTSIEVVAVADVPTASIDVTKILIDNNITQLPNNISHVKYYLSDGTTVKIDDYINPNTNPSDPTKYIKAIETDTGLKVVDYVIKAGTSVYSYSGTYLGNSITNGSSSNIFSNKADYTKTYTSTNEVYIFGTSSNKVTIDTINVKDITNGYKVEAYTTNGTKGELSEYKSSNVNGFGVKGTSSGNETEIGFKDSKSEEIRVKFDDQVTDVKVKFSWLASSETALIKFYKNGIEVGSTTQKGLTDTIDGPFNFKPTNGSTFDEIRFMAPANGDDYLINSIEFNKLIVNNSLLPKEIYKVDLTAALKDTDESETLTVKISGVPDGASFDLSNMTNLGGGIWEIIIPQGVKSIDYSNIKMVVPSDIKYVDLAITARATEINDNANGNNYAESKAIDSTIYGIDELEQVNMKTFKYNLVLTIDNSGSMDGDKITLAKAAMINLIDKYNGLGEVKILLNVFNNYGEIKGVWVNASNAKDLITVITAGGGTNYDDALLKNIDILAKNPAPLDGKTISYFVSDGEPTYGMYKSGDTWYRDGNGSNTTDINDSIVSQWKNLNIDKTYSIGIGTSQLNDYMREISKNPDEDVIVINDANQLAQTLENTVQELLVEGNVLNNVVGGDGKISIESINFDGVNYRKDNFPQDGLLIGNNKIKFTFDFETGNYKYYAKSSTFVEEKKTFTVNATDSNGDKDSFDVSVNVKVTQGKSENIQTLMGDDIDLSTVITKTVDIISLENSKIDKLKIDLKDVLDLEDKQLIVKGDLGDKVTLDTQNDWANGGKEELNGVNYKVYTGTGVNSTIKLLIEDDIDISSNI